MWSIWKLRLGGILLAKSLASSSSNIPANGLTPPPNMEASIVLFLPHDFFFFDDEEPLVAALISRWKLSISSTFEVGKRMRYELSRREGLRWK